MVFRKLFKIKWINFSHNEVCGKDKYRSIIVGYDQKLRIDDKY